MVDDSNNNNNNKNITHSNNKEFNNIDNWNDIELNEINNKEDDDHHQLISGDVSGSKNQTNTYIFNQNIGTNSLIIESPPLISNKTHDDETATKTTTTTTTIATNNQLNFSSNESENDGGIINLIFNTKSNNSNNNDDTSSVSSGSDDIENSDYSILMPFENDKGFTFRKLKSYLGPAIFVAVGYIDPGNVCTDIEGGSRFGYQLLWVILFSNIIALFLQTLVVKLALVSGNDLAQMCRLEFSTFINYVLWFISELAIISTDLAEVIGTAIGLNMLFGLPLIAGVAITLLDTFLFLAIQRWGIKKLEYIVLFLLSAITMCFVIELFLSKPVATQVFKGLFIPTLNKDSVFVATSIIGATVMPHNLFLHGSVVKSRKVSNDVASVKQAIKFNIVDTVLALNCAFFVNISILMLAAAVFFKHGIEVTELQQAYQLLKTLMNGKLAAILFGLSLFLAGQSSTICGTMSGQVVMEGFIKLKIKPWIRRLVTRSLAIVPALIVIIIFGEESTYTLLILSQVILSIALPFVIIPLILFTSDSNLMGEFKNSRAIILINSFIAIFITALNMITIFQSIVDFITNGNLVSKLLTIILIIPLTIALTILLIYIIFLKTNIYNLILNFFNNKINNNKFIKF